MKLIKDRYTYVVIDSDSIQHRLFLVSSVILGGKQIPRYIRWKLIEDKPFLVSLIKDPNPKHLEALIFMESFYREMVDRDAEEEEAKKRIANEYDSARRDLFNNEERSDVDLLDLTPSQEITLSTRPDWGSLASAKHELNIANRLAGKRKKSKTPSK